MAIYPKTQSFPTQSECDLFHTCKFELKSDHIEQKVTECVLLVKKANLMNKEAFENKTKIILNVAKYKQFSLRSECCF